MYPRRVSATRHLIQHTPPAFRTIYRYPITPNQRPSCTSKCLSFVGSSDTYFLHAEEGSPGSVTRESIIKLEPILHSRARFNIRHWTSLFLAQISLLCPSHVRSKWQFSYEALYGNAAPATSHSPYSSSTSLHCAC